jgi:hypothetical protein
MDTFRELQKKDCLDGSKNKRGKFGCPCCRKFSTTAKQKVFSRNRAKAKLKQSDKKNLTEDEDQLD